MQSNSTGAQPGFFRGVHNFPNPRATPPHPLPKLQNLYLDSRRGCEPKKAAKTFTTYLKVWCKTLCLPFGFNDVKHVNGLSLIMPTNQWSDFYLQTSDNATVMYLTFACDQHYSSLVWSILKLFFFAFIRKLMQLQNVPLFIFVCFESFSSSLQNQKFPFQVYSDGILIYPLG